MSERSKPIIKKLFFFLAIFGPGLVVMLADTDAGSIITAAQSGAVWGYKMISIQLVLIPVLYIAQELTVRLGVVTGKGHGQLIKQSFGKFWAWISVSTLLVCCVGAIISELVGVAGVGMLFGIAPWISVGIVITFLITMALTGSFSTIERCAIFIGLFELTFIVVAIMAHPTLKPVLHGLASMPITNPKYLYLAAANVGAVIMPWMIFYQQSAIVDKKLTIKNMRSARTDTIIGAIITQVIMISVIMATAATIGRTNPGAPLNTVHQISAALTPFLGHHVGRILFALGMLGASMVAAIVVSLTAAWGLGELTGYKCSLEDKYCEAPHFYSIYSATLILGGLLVISGINLVNLSVAIEVLNALLLPIVLGFLYLLAIKALPEKYRLKGWYAWVVGIILFATALFGVVAGAWGIFS